MGTELVEVASNGTVTTLGDVGGPLGEQVNFTYSFDLLAIVSGGRLYYWNILTSTLELVEDPGPFLDVVWVDGYFMLTDGEFLIVTELSDPTQINPLKYGSSEIDPDPVVGLLKLRNEIYALNRNTIEVFDNVGGAFFPFTRVEGAQIMKGCVGTNACCVYMESIAFLGGGRNEQVSIYLGVNANATKIATREIDQILENYTEVQLAKVLMEVRVFKNQQILYIHLPDRTLLFDGMTSQASGQLVWSVNTTSVVGFSQYRAKNFVYCYEQWIFGDPQSFALGTFTDTISSHYGETIRWEFGTLILYNESLGAVVHQVELVSLTGRVALGINPTISTSHSVDGQSFSLDRFISAGTTGANRKRLVWLQQGFMRNWRIQRFRGTSDAHISMARIEAQIEPMAA
jgi:hypothetical protein